MRPATLVAVLGLLSVFCVGQQELGSTSATSSIPTGSDRSREISAQNNPIVKAYADQIKKLGLGSVDFLNKLDVYQKVYSKAPKPAPGAISSLEIGALPSANPSQPLASEPVILKAAQELLIAYGVSEQHNIKLNELIKRRAQSPGLYEALAATMQTQRAGNQSIQKGLNMEVIAPDVKDSAMESIMAACTDLGFQCRNAKK